MRNRLFTLAFGVVLMLGTIGLGAAQNGGQQPSAREQLQHRAGPARDREVTSNQGRTCHSRRLSPLSV
jgi:hypothetical protein